MLSLLYTHRLFSITTTFLRKNQTFLYFCPIVENLRHKGDHKKRLWDGPLSDETAFRKMFEYYYADLCIFAKRYISDLHTREDLVQDVFCSVWLNREKIDYSVPISNYLVTSVKNICLNYLRTISNRALDKEIEVEQLPLYADNNDQFLLLNELEEMFNRILDTLPEEYRIAFVMSRMEDRSSDEIAERLHVSVRTVERYRNKAMEILRTELKDYLPLIFILLNIKL